MNEEMDNLISKQMKPVVSKWREIGGAQGHQTTLQGEGASVLWGTRVPEFIALSSVPCSLSPSQSPCHCSLFPRKARQPVVSFAWRNVWFYCQHDISNEKQMVSNVTWKKMHKQQQNYMFFFLVVFTGRICDLFAVNTAYNDMVHRSTAKKCVAFITHMY